LPGQQQCQELIHDFLDSWKVRDLPESKTEALLLAFITALNMSLFFVVICVDAICEVYIRTYVLPTSIFLEGNDLVLFWGSLRQKKKKKKAQESQKPSQLNWGSF